MGLKELLDRPHQLENANRLAHYINKHSESYHKLFKLLKKSSNTKKIQLVSWALGKSMPSNPNHLTQDISLIIELIHSPKHPSVRRNLLKLIIHLNFEKLDEELQGKLWEMCVDIMKVKHEPSSHHAYAMSIMEQIILLYPDLIQELKALIDLHEETMSAAVKSRKKHILKRLNKNKVN